MRKRPHGGSGRRVKNTFWKNKKVLITGHEGFLGSNLTRALLNCGADIFGLDIKTDRIETILTRQELKNVNATRGSVENLFLVSGIMRDKKIEFVFHLAAQALVEKGVKRPLKTFSTNIKGTWNILEASKRNGSVRAVVIASSDKAYGIQEELPYEENFSLKGSHPYDVSKSCTDLLAHTYFNTYGLPVCTTRCGNIIGPGDFNFSRIVPDAVRSALRNRPLFIRSDGKFIRDYIYVEDVVAGYLALARKMRDANLFGEAFNFSYEKPISVLDLVKIIYRACGRKPAYRILDRAKYEIKDQYLSSKKAQRILGWKPKHTMEEALKKTVSWYKENLGII